MTLSPTFESQQGSYTASKDVSDNDDETALFCPITPVKREGQSVSYSLGEATTEGCGAQIKSKVGYYTLYLGMGGDEIPGADLPAGALSGQTATIVLNVTVSQSGYESSVYTVTITRNYYTYNEVEVEISG